MEAHDFTADGSWPQRQMRSSSTGTSLFAGTPSEAGGTMDTANRVCLSACYNPILLRPKVYATNIYHLPAIHADANACTCIPSLPPEVNVTSLSLSLSPLAAGPPTNKVKENVDTLHVHRSVK